MKLTRKMYAGGMTALLVMVTASSPAWSHCEIPCGIYDDHLRVSKIRENLTTIEKSMKMITKLSGRPGANMNQLVRWVNNKEHHADDIRQIVTQYFMAQRVKPIDKEKSKESKKYVRQLTLLHRMIVQAMKCKQTTDMKHVNNIRSLVDEFEKAYFGPEARKHLKEHPKGGSGSK